MGCVPSALADSALMRGIDAYRKNDYVQAQSYLRQAIKAAPEDSVAHYYMANTMVKLRNPAGARTEFRLASESSETDDIRENSKVALQQLQLPNGKNAKFDASIDGLIKKDAPNSMRLDSLPFTTEERKAISPYLKQNGELDQAKSSSIVKDLLPADLKNKAQGIGPQDPALPGLLSDFLSQTQFGNAMSPAERKSFIESELHKRNIPMDSILQMINGKTGSASTSKPSVVPDEHTKRLQEVKDNLDDQMNSKVGGSNVHIDPQGTSIYVRNYEHQ